jgi:flavin reductase (DIM6/NTAB) family NADH-FMN oxidoreductase RutF
MSIDPDSPRAGIDDHRPAPAFRDAMARLAGGVAVLTTLDPVGRQCGLTVTAVASLSLEPPMVLVSVKKDGFIHDALYVADGWSLTFLATDQVDLAHYAARGRAPGDRDDFGRWPHRPAGTGEFVFTGGVAAVSCESDRFIEAGDHTVAIGRVTAVAAGLSGHAPLVHVDRAYIEPGRVLGAHDESLD